MSSRIKEREDIKPKIVEANGITVGVYKFRGKYYAYENVCAHEGGPICEGVVLGKPECEVSKSGRRLRNYLSDREMTLVCPWHGVAYDLETGICLADKELKLNSFEVKETRDGHLVVKIQDKWIDCP